jgi:hypothetical protein
VVAFGAELAVIPETLRLQAGYNHGSSPVKGEGINALFTAVTQDHVSGGVGVTVTEGLMIEGALEYAFENSVAANGQNQMTRQPGTTNPNGYGFEGDEADDGAPRGELRVLRDPPRARVIVFGSRRDLEVPCEHKP